MYTGEEIQAAVEKLVRGSIRRPVDTLGVRRVDIGFSDVQEAGATVLLLNNAGPFYCLALGAQRLRDLVLQEAALIDQVIEAIAATGRRVSPIESVDMLFGAKAALEELESAAASRTQGFKDITKVPSYQRFASNVATYLDGPAQNIKQSGDIVQTPDQARQALPSLLRQLATLHGEVAARATLLAKGIEDFKAVNLPALVASGAISRARQVIGEHAEVLDRLSKEDRLLKVRDVTLDVLAAKAVVTQFGSFSGPTTYYPILGVGSPYADSARPATPAYVISSTLDAVTLLAGGATLAVSADGSPLEQTLDLDPSLVGAVSSSNSEATNSSPGWRIGDGVDPAPPPDAATPDNNELRIRVGATLYPVVLTLSPDYTTFRSAQEICDDINGQIPGDVLEARPIFSPLEYSGPLDIDAGGLTTTFHVPAGASNLVALGVKVGHLVEILAGPNAGLFPITSVAATSVVVSRPAGTFSAELGRNAEMGPPLRRIRLKCANPAVQVPAQTKLTVLGDTVKSANACDTFGFYPGIFSQCLMTTIDEVVAQVNGRTNAFVASAAFAPVLVSRARSNTLEAAGVTFFKVSGVADAVWGGPYVTLIGAFDVTKVFADDVLVLRSGPNPNAFGVITDVSAGALVAIMGAPGTNAMGVSFDIGAPMTASEYMTVRIDEGPNRGDYLVLSQGVTPLDFILKNVLPQTRLGIEPLFFAAQLGRKALVLSGKSTGLSAALSVSGSGASTFFGLVPAVAYGTTRYFQLPQVPRGITAGDVLELYNSQYNVPTTQHVIDLVDASVRVIRVTPEISTHLPAAPPERWVFGDQVPPFARVRITQTFDYTTFQKRLLAWLGMDVNQPSYFRVVSREVNPLLVNTNVLAVDVADATNTVLELSKALTLQAANAHGGNPALSLEYALAGYQVPLVPAVDTLLKSYKEKGSDRAVDLLLQGLFGAFFGLTLDDASYAGAMQAAMREVAREDLVVRRTERTEATAGPRQLSEADSPDYDYDASDIEQGAEVDPPA